MYKQVYIKRKNTDLEEIGNGTANFNRLVSAGYSVIVSHNSSQSADKFGNIVHIDSIILS